MATLVQLPSSGVQPPPTTKGGPLEVSHPGPTSLEVKVPPGSGERVLRLPVTDVPGWHATIDGHQLTLHHFAGVMLEANVPPGAHTVKLHYWPGSSTIGIVLALLAVAGLVAAGLFVGVRRGQLGRL